MLNFFLKKKEGESGHWFAWRRSARGIPYPHPVYYAAWVVYFLYGVIVLATVAPLVAAPVPIGVLLRVAGARILMPTFILAFILWKKAKTVPHGNEEIV